MNGEPIEFDLMNPKLNTGNGKIKGENYEFDGRALHLAGRERAVAHAVAPDRSVAVFSGKDPDAA